MRIPMYGRGRGSSAIACFFLRRLRQRERRRDPRQTASAWYSERWEPTGSA
jgi:hypothetical protein